jgi:hypothetical protein
MPSPVTVTVPYSVAPGTASLDDFTPASAVLEFPPGVTEFTFLVGLAADQVSEPPETVLLSLGTQPSGFQWTPPGATLTIVDAGQRQFLPCLLR